MTDTARARPYIIMGQRCNSAIYMDTTWAFVVGRHAGLPLHVDNSMGTALFIAYVDNSMNAVLFIVCVDNSMGAVSFIVYVDNSMGTVSFIAYVDNSMGAVLFIANNDLYIA